MKAVVATERDNLAVVAWISTRRGPARSASG